MDELQLHNLYGRLAQLTGPLTLDRDLPEIPREMVRTSLVSREDIQDRLAELDPERVLPSEYDDGPRVRQEIEELVDLARDIARLPNLEQEAIDTKRLSATASSVIRQIATPIIEQGSWFSWTQSDVENLVAVFLKNGLFHPEDISQFLESMPSPDSLEQPQDKARLFQYTRSVVTGVLDSKVEPFELSEKAMNAVQQTLLKGGIAHLEGATNEEEGRPTYVGEVIDEIQTVATFIKQCRGSLDREFFESFQKSINHTLQIETANWMVHEIEEQKLYSVDGSKIYQVLMSLDQFVSNHLPSAEYGEFVISDDSKKIIGDWYLLALSKTNLFAAEAMPAMQNLGIHLDQEKTVSLINGHLSQAIAEPDAHLASTLISIAAYAKFGGYPISEDKLKEAFLLNQCSSLSMHVDLAMALADSGVVTPKEIIDAHLTSELPNEGLLSWALSKDPTLAEYALEAASKVPERINADLLDIFMVALNDASPRGITILRDLSQKVLNQELEWYS